MSWIYVAVAATTAVAGAVMEGDAQRKSANTQADWVKKNQEIASEQAGAREEAMRRDTAQQLGRAAAAQAQSGVDASSGSALAVAAQSATMAELDALNVRYEGQMKRFGYAREESTLRASARNAQNATWFKAASGIVNAVGSGYAMGAGKSSAPTTTPSVSASGGNPYMPYGGGP
jgi:hypothetical protein